MSKHRGLLPIIVGKVTVKVKIIRRR